MLIYKKTQKYISFTLILAILVSLVFNISLIKFFDKIFAQDNKDYNIVSIFVEQDIFSGVRDSVINYAQNIQKSLEKTRVVIIPIPGNTNPFNIASINEKLYFEGSTKWLDGVEGGARLVGSVFIGDIALPVVENQGSFEKTVLPYVDFKDKAYIFDNSTGIYKRSDNILDIKAEIWHGFISPGGERGEKISKINDYFKKNDDYYKGTGLFDQSKIVINGKKGEKVNEKYKPYVFYFDQIRESKALKYVDYTGYKGYLKNLEDIYYKRYNKNLALKLKDDYFKAQQEYIGDIGELNLDSSLKKQLEKSYGDNSNLLNVPDITLRHVIRNSYKLFIEAFNKDAIGKFKKYVHNAGRYNQEGSKVNVDFIPSLVSGLDNFSAITLKSINKDLEKKIYEVIVGGGKDKNNSKKIVKDIIVLDTISYKDEKVEQIITNLFYGKHGKEQIKDVEDCTIYRGSNELEGNLVEGNRGFNFYKAKEDAEKLGSCIGENPQLSTKGYWGGNSSLNLNTDKIAKSSQWELNPLNKNNGAIVPVFDIVGGLKTEDNTKISNPKDCLKNNLIVTFEKKSSDKGNSSQKKTVYSVPIDNQPAIGWNCKTDNTLRKSVLTESGNYYYYDNLINNNIKDTSNTGNSNSNSISNNSRNNSRNSSSSCVKHIIKVDGKVVKTVGSSGGGFANSCRNKDGVSKEKTFEYNYFTIPSSIEHVSPTTKEITKQVKKITSPNLPIDKIRYLEYFGLNGKQLKIDYPNLFAIKVKGSPENTKKEITKILDEKSRIINNIIKEGGSGSEANIDLNKFLEENGEKEVTIMGDKKKLNQKDMLSLAVYWANLDDISQKYKFIFENYLSDKNSGTDNSFFYPNNKKLYEIAYVGAPGDGANMYVKLDPEEKGENPYKDLIGKIIETEGYLTDTSIKNYGINTDTDFKCSPPEGVPIWKWLPAVTCRLKNLMPPKIKIEEGICGYDTLFLDYLNRNSKDIEEFEAENGIGKPMDDEKNYNSLNDYINEKIIGGKLNITSDKKQYGYNEVGNLSIKLYDSNGKVLDKDIISKVKLEIVKLEALEDNKWKNIYNIENGKPFGFNEEEENEKLRKYINFKSLDLRLYKGKAIYNFSTKSKDIKATFRIKLLKKQNGEYKEEPGFEENISIEVSKKNNKSKEIIEETGSAKELRINFGTKIIEKGNAVTTNFLSIYDEKGNLVVGKPYGVNIILDDNSGLTFSDGTRGKKFFQIYEGYRLFNLRTGNKPGNNTVKFELLGPDRKKILEKTETISIVDRLNFNIEVNQSTSDKNYYDYKLTLYSDNKERFNGKAYLTNNDSYFYSDEPYIKIEKGVGVGKIKKTGKAGENVKLEFKIDGVINPVSTYVNILPDVPSKVDLVLDKTKIEASSSASAKLFVELRDKYGNIVFNDNSTIIDLEILDKYKHIINTTSLNKKVDKGKAEFLLYGTETPGTAYFKVSAHAIKGNNITIIGDGGDQLVINPIWERVGKIETFYFWNKQKIDNATYNSLYTTLLGSNYGDLTIKDNLANSIIFNKNNKALGVTSLLNTTDRNNEVFLITPEGDLKMNYVNNKDLLHDIRNNIYINNKGEIELSLINNTFSSLISTIKINLSNFLGVDCENENNIKGCFAKNPNNNSFILKELNDSYETTKSSNNVILRNKFTKEKLFEINNGIVKKFGNLELELEKNDNGILTFGLKEGFSTIGNLYINLGVSNNIIVTRDSNQPISSGGILIYLESRNHIYKEVYTGSSSKQKKGYSIIYNDPFETDRKSLDGFYKEFYNGYENFYSKEGLGWEAENKILLGFAAGKSIGEATKDYMSFGLINIGDPLISLKSIPKKLPGSQTETKRFDSTIGQLISKDFDNLNFTLFDYNGDKNTDIAILKKGGFVELRESNGVFGDYINRGNLLFVPDIMDNSPIESGDFFGDGYDDLVFLNKDRELIVFSNRKKKFIRVENNVTNNIDGKINRMLAYDMDKDGLKDLVILTDNGNIYILYGTKNEGIFDIKKIGYGFGAKLDKSNRITGGALYFDGLHQLSKENNKDSENSEILNNIIYTTFNHTPKKPENTNEADGNSDLENYGVLGGVPEIDNSLSEAKEVMKDYTQDAEIEYKGGENYGKENEKTFIKSEYSKDLEGIDITKKYIKDGDILKSQESVTLDINITNNSGKPLNNVVYMEKMESVFIVNMDYNAKVNIGGKNVGNALLNDIQNSEYSLLIDSYNNNGKIEKINLKQGETINITLKLKTRSFSYGNIEVGDFDDTTIHGDILVKQNHKNCGDNNLLYKSVGPREYQKDYTDPVCETDLPKELKDISNGKIDRLKDGIDKNNGKTTKEFEKFAKDGLDDILKDSDGDGIPDSEDINPNYNDDDGDFMELFDNNGLDEKLEKITDGIDTILAGLSCGFGGGGCIATPLNWAPLAPGSDPTLFGIPIGDGLRIDEGFPIFSSLTWMYTGKACVPTVFPVSPLGDGCITGLGAGGMLGINSVSNKIRIFVTPTLTGGVGTAICFGGPASLAGISNPPMFHPLVPGGNCIIAAAPLIGCKGDGSDGDIQGMWSGIGKGSGKGGEGADIINGTDCSPDSKKNATSTFIPYVKDYDNYKKGNNNSFKLKEIYKKVAKGNKGVEFPDRPLLDIGLGNEPQDLEVELDFSAIKDGNYADVLKINMSRISPFPDFIMNWVTRQIEEIANKLTDFPTLNIIMPDFSSLYDSGWKGFSSNIKGVYEKGKDEAKINEEKLEKQKPESKECKDNKGECISNNLKRAKLNTKQVLNYNPVKGGISAVYEFLGNLPIINVEPQTVNINIPWIDETTLNKALVDYQTTYAQWESEIKNFTESINYKNYTCAKNLNDPNCKAIIEARALLGSLKKNMDIIKSYMDIPAKIYELLKIKDVRLSQILCNIEIISKITGGWIGFNGKRFKAWVELYILIKAILKSWQLLVDIFIDYDAECHQCKNERNDLQYFIWKLISSIMPKIPIIRFPKWPDLYLDLHDIRVDINVGVPEFEFNLRPIVLPRLPKLSLPEGPSGRLSLPSLPLLPEFKIPELPELPSLPSIELPNLPPPPKLPKLLTQIEAFLKILKLITKAMCILKTSPFVPEWRAGDQIAYITERKGYLNFDFFDISIPEFFSYSFLEGIKVKTYVNFDMDVDFLVEMSKQIAMPINTFGNDIANMFKINLGDIDLTEYQPPDVNVDVKLKDSFNYDTTSKKNNGFAFNYVNELASKLQFIYDDLSKDGSKELSNKEFKKEISQQLPKLGNDKLVGLFKDVLNYGFTKEDKIINDLLINNEEKFNEFKSIIEKEKIKSMKDYDILIERLSKKPNTPKLVSNINKSSLLKDANTRLEKYFIQSKESYEKLYKEDENVNEIKDLGNKIFPEIKDGLNKYNEEIAIAGEGIKNDNMNLLALNSQVNNTINPAPLSTNNVNTSNSCKISDGSSKNNGYGYIYKGLYVVDKIFPNKKVSYRLFDYLDEVTGKEKAKKIDFDLTKYKVNGDINESKDLVYMVGNEIYIKKNLKKNKLVEENYTGMPSVITSGNISGKWDGQNTQENPLFPKYIEAVNGFTELVSDNKYVNLGFKPSTNKNIGNYRIEIYDIVDNFAKYIGENDNNLNASSKDYNAGYIIDSFADIDKKTEFSSSNNNNNGINILFRNNLVIANIIEYLSGFELETPEVKNLSNISNSTVVINSKTKIYTGNIPGKINYYVYGDSNKMIKPLSIPENSNVEFDKDIVIESANNIFISTDNLIHLNSSQINDYLRGGKPLLPGTILKKEGDDKTFSSQSNNTKGKLKLKSYDGTISFIDFSKTKYYSIIDLGDGEYDYTIRTKIPNDFYYSKIRSYKNNIFSSFSNQTLLSPQKEADKLAPYINIKNIRIPVHTKKVLDVTNEIFKEGGIKRVKEIYIDFDLTTDFDGDNNPKNDSEFNLENSNKSEPIIIKKTDSSILFEFGEFDKLIKKLIRIHVVDDNNNIGYKDVLFEVYAPNPHIDNIDEKGVIKGGIDENLEGQKVGFYRTRNGSVAKLKGKNGKEVGITTSSGSYVFETEENIYEDKGGYVSDGGNKILLIDENTGKITNNPGSRGLSYSVLPSNSDENEFAFPKIVVFKDGKPIFHQYISLPNYGEVNIVDSFNKLTDIGMYYKHIDFASYDYNIIPTGARMNGGDVFITNKSDGNKTPIISIFKDGRVDIYDNNYKLEYISSEEYVLYRIVKKDTHVSIGDIMLIPEKNYVNE